MGKAEKKPSLEKLKTETVYKCFDRKRALVEGLRGETAARAIGELDPGCEIFGFTKGQFSLVNILEYLLETTGPADVFISTWSAATGDIKQAKQFLRCGNIKSIKFLVDFSFKSRKPHFLEELVEAFGPDCVRLTVTHAKFALIKNEKWNLIIRTSMNLNYNPRFENFEISDDKALMAFMEKISYEIWNTPEVALSLEQNPYAVRKTFSGLYGKTEMAPGAEDINRAAMEKEEGVLADLMSGTNFL